MAMHDARGHFVWTFLGITGHLSSFFDHYIQSLVQSSQFKRWRIYIYIYIYIYNVHARLSPVPSIGHARAVHRRRPVPVT